MLLSCMYAAEAIGTGVLPHRLSSALSQCSCKWIGHKTCCACGVVAHALCKGAYPYSSTMWLPDFLRSVVMLTAVVRAGVTGNAWQHCYFADRL